MRLARPKRPALWMVFAMLAVAIPGVMFGMSGSTARPGSDASNASPSPTPQGRPNIILIQSDDQTPEQLAAMPKLARDLGAHGATHDRYFASYPLCCPSRATLLTGQYSHNHGVEGNFVPHGGHAKLDQAETLGVWLSRAGYTTGHVGKYLNGYGKRDPLEVPPGWDTWVSPPHPHMHSFTDYELNIDGALVPHGAAEADHIDDVYTGHAVDFIARNAAGDRPFFLSLNYLAPHRGEPYGPGRCGPYAKPAPRHAGAFTDGQLPPVPNFDEEDVSDKPAPIRARKRLGPRDTEKITENYQCRRAALLALDDGVERIVAELGRLGELGHTYIFYVSDNSYSHGEHRIPRGKQRVYETNVRVPFLARGPGIPAGSRHDTVAANIDIAPTVLDAAGAGDQVPDWFKIDGRSLLPALTGRPGPTPGPGADRAVLLENGPEAAEVPQYDAIRTARYTYVEYLNGERELYDLDLDPYQLDSRHNDPAYAAVRAELAEGLAVLRECAGRTCDWARALPQPGPGTTNGPARPEDQS